MSTNPPSRKRPDPKPKRECTPEPEPAIAPKTPVNPKPVATSAKSNKRKAVDEGERAHKCEAPKASSSKAGGSKGQQAKKEDKDTVIDLVSDDEGGKTITNFVKKKEESNKSVVAFMNQEQKIQHLKKSLEDANKTITNLRLEVIKLKQELKVQARVEAEVARRLAMAPAPPHHQLLPANAPAPHLGHHFDGEHPFNRAPAGDNIMFGM